MHIFGSKVSNKKIMACAQAHNINYHPLKLGHIATMRGQRWLKHHEISIQVEQLLAKVSDQY